MKKTIFAVAICCLSAGALAEKNSNSEAERIEFMQTGRYSYVENIPLVDQRNPLKVVVKTRIPQSLNTVGKAVAFLLVRSGYGLAEQSILSDEAKTMLTLPLPQVHREIGPMTLDKALHMLSGEAFELVIDPVHRRVSYELSPKLVGSK